MKMLEAKNIEKSFDKLEVLKNISFDVNKGEVLAIIGPSGSGKSTLLRCITQLETIDKGEIVICGDTLVKTFDGKAVYASKEDRHKINMHYGLVFQNFNLFPHMSVMKNITAAPINVLGKSKEEAEATAKSLLKKMGLADRGDYYPYQLSGGQQQRVAIARALANKPALLLADEPTGNLDSKTAVEVIGLLKASSQKYHQTVLMVTHNEALAQTCDRIIRIEDGRLYQREDAFYGEGGEL